MRSSELLSKEWCDIVFEHRNRDYGAYRLRQRAGARYRYALIVVVGGFLLTATAAVGTAVYVRYMMQRETVNAEDLLNELKPTNLKEGYKMHFVQTARLAPRISMGPGATQGTPEIVEGNPETKIIGIKDKFIFEPDENLIITPIEEETRAHDSTLPLAKQKIVPTEVVKQLPEFPGGAQRFMKWLNDHIVYPQRCLDLRQEGEVSMSFVVGTDGYAQDLEVKGAFDAEIYRTIKNAFSRMPKWQPGKNEQGEPTPVIITVPIKFHL